MSDEERMLIDILTVVEEQLESLPTSNSPFQKELNDRYLEMLYYLEGLIVIDQEKRG